MPGLDSQTQFVTPSVHSMGVVRNHKNRATPAGDQSLCVSPLGSLSHRHPFSPISAKPPAQAPANPRATPKAVNTSDSEIIRPLQNRAGPPFLRTAQPWPPGSPPGASELLRRATAPLPHCCPGRDPQSTGPLHFLGWASWGLEIPTSRSPHYAAFVTGAGKESVT